MKLQSYSILKTPDNEGLTIKSLADELTASCEVCVRITDKGVEVNIHSDGVDDPVATLKLPIPQEVTS